MAIIKDLIETQEFATLPVVAAKLLKLLENEDISSKDLAHIIEMDSSMTLKLLRVANSPIYGTRQTISSINQAIMTLGLNRITNIVLGVSIFSRFLLSSQKFAAEVLEKYWWHSSCTGIVAKALAKKLNTNFRENEFIGGLLHDIGKLAMIQYDSVKYTKVNNIIYTKRIHDCEAEKEVFGVDHIEVGSEISKLWKLPESLYEVITYHNHPSQAINHQDLTACVRFADLLCEMWGADVNEGYDYLNLEEDESWVVICQLHPEIKDMDIVNFTFELEHEYKKSTEFLNAITAQ